MEYYVELKVGLRKSRWYGRLMQVLKPYHVKWQDDYYHITMAFINDMNVADADRLNRALGETLSDMRACCETFGIVNAFTTNRGDEHIVYLIPKVVSEHLDTLVTSVRKCCSDLGIAIVPNYKHHITLGRVDIATITLDKLQALVTTVQIPEFELRLDVVRLVKRRGHQQFNPWQLK